MATAHTPDCASWSGRREGEKGLDWRFKSHLGSESLGYREGKELMSEDGWAARWGLMLMGELKLSTQTRRGQNCRSVFLMLTPSPNQCCKSAFSIGGRGSEEKRDAHFSLFLFFSLPCANPHPTPSSFVLSQSLLPTRECFPLKFPIFGFPSRIEGMVSACRRA